MTAIGAFRPGADPTVAQSFAARSERFRTWRGLRPRRHGVADVRERHPRAVRHGASWWLRTTRAYGSAPFAVAEARIGADGRVRALRGWIGPAGE